MQGEGVSKVSFEIYSHLISVKKKDEIPLPYTLTLSYNDDTSIKEDLSTYVDVDVYAHKLSFTSQLCWNDVGIDWLIDWVWLFYVF